MKKVTYLVKQPKRTNIDGISIAIVGPAGVGKTTIAILIGEALAQAGLDVTVTDDAARTRLANDHHAKALASISDKSPKINISTVQTPPSSRVH